MDQPVLYLMLGYPGAGKTTVSRKIAELTGAVHLWADHERRAMFQEPTHSKAESDKLYAHLNRRTDELLSRGKSVIFDTSFNHFTDREYLRTIAAKHGARTVLLWLSTPRHTAQARAVDIAHAEHNKYEQTMSLAEFNRIADHLEPPHPPEHAIEIDGTNFDETILRQKLSLA